MIKEVLANFEFTGFTCLALLIFFSVFVGVLVWTFRKSNRKLYEKLQNLPLEEDPS